MSLSEVLHVASLIYAQKADVRAAKDNGSRDKLNKGLAVSSLRAAQVFVETVREEIKAQEKAQEDAENLEAYRQRQAERQREIAESEKAKRAGVGHEPSPNPAPLPPDPAQVPKAEPPVTWDDAAKPAEPPVPVDPDLMLKDEAKHEDTADVTVPPSSSRARKHRS